MISNPFWWPGKRLNGQMFKGLISFLSSGVWGHEGAGLLWHRGLHGEEEGGRVHFIDCWATNYKYPRTRSSKAGTSASWRFSPRIRTTSTRTPSKFDPVHPFSTSLKPYLSSLTQDIAWSWYFPTSSGSSRCPADQRWPAFGQSWPCLLARADRESGRQSTSIQSHHRSRSIRKLPLDIFLPSLLARAACCGEWWRWPFSVAAKDWHISHRKDWDILAFCFYREGSFA